MRLDGSLLIQMEISWRFRKVHKASAIKTADDIDQLLAAMEMVANDPYISYVIDFFEIKPNIACPLQEDVRPPLYPELQ